MPKNEKYKQKLFRLLQILMEKTDEEHGLSMPEIIRALESFGIKAERKSIYDDLLTLEELGFTVAKMNTRPPRYTLEERIFELAELKMLVDAIQSSRFVSSKKCREIISKLELFAGEHSSRELSRQVYVEDRVRNMNSSAFYNVDTIHFAINSNKQITFKYFDYDVEKKKALRHGGEPYTVSAAALLWNDQNYYLVGYDEREGIMKNFRVDKMQNVTVTDEQRCEAVSSSRFNPAVYSQKLFGMYGGKEELVTLECREKLAGVIIDRFGIEPTFTKTDFGFKVSVKVIVSPNFFAWVLGFGKDMRIISPLWVREELISAIREISENYRLPESSL
ncbi:MAG: WYL domain-containing protein [Clostridia bacterium]|nr:WYL domain-containing protein [Clostridia bacterium]